MSALSSPNRGSSPFRERKSLPGLRNGLVFMRKSRAASVVCLRRLAGEGDLDAFPDWELCLQAEQDGVGLSGLGVNNGIETV